MRQGKYQEALNLLRHNVPNFQIRVYRHNKDAKENISLVESSVELYKKPGKGLGLSVVGIHGEPGVVITEIVSF